MNSFELDIFSLFLQASIVVQVVMIILILASLSSWWIIFERWTTLNRAKKDIFSFEKFFWSQNKLDSLFLNISKKENKIGNGVYLENFDISGGATKFIKGSHKKDFKPKRNGKYPKSKNLIVEGFKQKEELKAIQLEAFE